MADASFNETDRLHMARALELARRGLGHVEPNPMVGAVLADGPRIIAQGFHARFGGPHAEAAALADAGDAARGASLYVTLEPCAHHGKTPPCADAVVAAGVTRVVAAMQDPFPQVAGRGFDILRRAAVTVDVGLLEPEARRLNAPFIKRQTTGRPYVIAKWAMTLDGRMASVAGDSRWISSPASRAWVHSLRSRVDAVIVGAGTVLADDPQLTVRLSDADAATDYGRRPARVVLDDALQMPPASALARGAPDTPLLVATTRPADCEPAQELIGRGVEVLSLPADETGGVSVDALLEALCHRDMTNVLVEGGRTVLASFFRASAIDAVAIFIAPKLIGGDPTHAAPGPHGLRLMNEALPLLRPTYTPIGDDVLIQGPLRDY